MRRRPPYVECCVSPHYYDKHELQARLNATRHGDGELSDSEKEEAKAVEAMKEGDLATMSESRVADFVKSDDQVSGPLIDRIYIEEGASYVLRRHIAQPAGSGFKSAFDSVTQAPDDVDNAGKFCTHGKVVEPDNYGSLLKTCGETDTFKADARPHPRGSE